MKTNGPHAARVRHLIIAVAMGVLPLACGSEGSPGTGIRGSSGEPVSTVSQASSGSCPVTITIPSANEAVGQFIQLSVSQSCSNWTNAMIAYIDSVSCASSSYPYPNSGCATNNGAQNFSTSTWVEVTPGQHTLIVNNWNSSGAISVSNPVSFTYTPPSGVTISAPANNASVSNPVTVTASASESVPIGQMQVWDNGSKLGFYCNTGGCTGSTSDTMSLSQSYTLAAGAHQLTVEDENDSAQVLNKTVVNFTVTGGNDPVLVGAGDIGYPGGGGGATGAELQTLVNANPGAMVFTLGDDAYGNSNCDEGGSPTDYANYYTPTAWQSLIGITLPNPGNHEYNNCDLSNTVGPCQPSQGCGSINGSSWVMNGYWPHYNGHAAVTPGGGTATSLHYGYDFTTSGGKKWRYVSVDSGMCFYTNNCSQGSSEYSWLSSELAAHTKGSYNGGPYTGIVVGTHIDRWDSAGCPGGSSWLADMFNLAFSYKVDLWLDGHVHGYERFAQLGPGCQSGETASGCGTFCGPAANSAGPVLIDLGSGGADDWSGITNHPLPNSLARIAGTYAVGRLRLHDASWDFTLYNTSNAVIDGMVTYSVH